MKQIIIVSMILLNSCYAQKKVNSEIKDCGKYDLTFINNKTIDYSIVMMSCDTCVPIRNIGYRVVINLKEKDMRIVGKLNRSCWIALLQNDKSDWAANLILYSLKNEDALLLSQSDVDDWKKNLKKNDLIYWAKLNK
jgi:hypothetical protein